MRKYEEPKLNEVAFDVEDIIQTSNGLTAGGNAQVPGTGVIVPIPEQTDLDSEY